MARKSRLQLACCSLALTCGMVLSACQSNYLPARVVEADDRSTSEADKPAKAQKPVMPSTGPAEGPVTTRLEEVTGILKSIDRRGNRFIVQMDNGKLLRLKLSGLPNKSLAVRVDQRVGFSLQESVEILRNQYLHPVNGQAVAREPPGSGGERENYNSYYNRAPTGHHGTQWVEVMDIPAKVVKLYPERSEIRLLTQRGRQFTVRVSDPSIDLSKVMPNESVIARFREIDEIYPIED